jgi:parallel beta-helix repeat protein
MNFKVLISAVLASLIAVVGCDSSSTGTGGTAGNGGSGGEAGMGGVGGSGGGIPPWEPITDCANVETPTNYAIEGAPDTETGDCDETLGATGDNDASAINTAVELASSGDTICLSAGTYDMNDSVVVSSAANLTIKGIGASVDDVVLDYDGRGDRGFDVTTDGFTIENMTLINTAGNGVEVKAAGSTFRKLNVYWADEEGNPTAVPSNGAYSVYPTKCTDTIVEYVQVQGASDAGVYVGQCEGGSVRYNKVFNNVAGLEVENSKDVDVYGNDIFFNTGGLLALQEPNLDRLANENILMRENFVYCNNHDNFARPGTTVSNIPVGTGSMSFAGLGIELRNNIMDSNISTAMLVVSNVILCQFAGTDCGGQPGYSPYPERIYIHDNAFFNNGEDPQSLVGDIAQLTGIPTPEVIWDGYIDPDTDDPEICLGDPVESTYINLSQDECQDVVLEPIDPMDPDSPLDETPLVLCFAGNFTEDAEADARNCDLSPVTF